MKRSNDFVRLAARGGRLTKAGGTVVSIAPSVIAGAMIANAPQASADTVTTTQTTAFVTSDTGDHTIESGGSVQVDPVAGDGAVVLTAPDYSGTLANHGTVSAANGILDEYAGVVVAGDLSGAINNAGSITAAQDGGVFRYIRGIEVQQDVSGTILTSGSVHAELTNADFYGDAVAVEVQNVSGTIRNEGSLSVYAEGEDMIARGIYTEDVSGEIVNTGTISLTAEGTLDASADGIEAGHIGGQVVNSGDILLTVTSGHRAQANDGIEVRDVSGHLENSGTITAVIAAGVEGRASVDGIETSTITGTFVNSGQISLDVTGGYTGADAIDTSAIEAGAEFTNTADLSYTSQAGSESLGNDSLDLGDIHGDAINHGTLYGMATAEDLASAGSIDFYDVTGMLTNTGDITLIARADFGDALAEGIAGDDVDGVLSNSGTLDIQSEGLATAESYGIAVRDINGVLSNSGDMTVAATAGDYALASGLDVYDMSGHLENSGAITSQSTGSYADAFGIISGALLSGGTLVNSGDVTAVAHATSSAVIPEMPLPPEVGLGAYASALDLWDIESGAQALNTGTLSSSATVTGSGMGEALGLFAGTVDGNLRNEGSVNVSVYVDAGLAGSAAVAIDGVGVAGSFENTGNLTSNATLDTDGFLNATGISVTGAFGRVLNHGNISALSGSTSESAIGAIALGIEAFDLGTTGYVENMGALNVTANSGGGFATAIGIASNLADAGSQIIHSGAISVTGQGANSRAYGIFASQANGTVTVTGDISSAAEDEAYAVMLQDGAGQLEIETTATLDGLIGVGRHDVTLTHVGGNQIYYFEDTATADGTFETIVAIPNGAWFSKDTGGDAPVYASYVAQGLAPNMDESFAIAGLTATLGRQLDGQQSRPEVSRNQTSLSAERPVWTGPSPYAVFTTNRSRNSGLLDSRLHSLSVGLTGETDTGLRLGAGVSVLENDGTYDGNGFGTDGYLLSALAAKDFGWADLHFGVGFGGFNHNSSRQIGNSPDAVSNYDSTLWNVHLGMRRDYDLQNGMIFTPELSLIYGEHDREAYTETGSLANATVGARNSSFGEARLGTGFALPTNSGFWRASVSAVHRDGNRPGAVNVSIFGDTVTFSTPGYESETFGEIALGYEADFGNGGTLRVGAISTIGASTETQALAASYKLVF
ncbi:autotransporter-like protein [Shimia isoporae]|uniref:Autotransporter-like protein n=1 Tax=Shimia isoporae TaxID=647720 RepID=A0A4R1N4D5_9RHOB|nr:autotransporter outer membrane beta-barrel domain-containing protein [Shimia isoporae]TCL00565.1 autotransporter-like protein [Shimia isoporae]